LSSTRDVAHGATNAKYLANDLGVALREIRHGVALLRPARAFTPLVSAKAGTQLFAPTPGFPRARACAGMSGINLLIKDLQKWEMSNFTSVRR
jgi:hypothetical protein